MTSLAPLAPRKLPVRSTVGACYVAVARNLGQLVRISWLWLVILAPVYAALLWLDWAWWRNLHWAWWQVNAIVTPGAVGPIVESPFLASIAVAWHRLLLHQERVTARAYRRLDGTVWLYLTYSLLLMVLVQAPFVVAVTLIGPIVSDLIWALGLWFAGLLSSALTALLVLSRLSLVLPAVALGERLSLAEAWRMSRGNTPGLALATFLCILPAFLPMLAVLGWVWSGGTESQTAYIVCGMITSFGYAVLAILVVTLLSLTYRFFTAPGEKPPTPTG